MPPMDDDNFSHEDMAVMMMTNDGWQLYDTPIKFVRNAVSFDTRQLTKLVYENDLRHLVA
jgi:hypothetical protein